MIKSELLSSLTFIGHGFFNKNDSKDLKNPITLKQIHSPEVVVLNQYPEKGATFEADGLVTSEKGLCLTIKTADCAPVLFADPDARIIGAAHAGWKGALGGILERTLLTMIKEGAHLSSIRAAIGPCLQKKSFIVKEDMKNLFPISDSRFFTEENGEIHFDFESYVISRLLASGIRSEHLSASGVDTYASKDYLSYRREPENPAREYSAIWIK